mgnify:CR=1 FL=1
MLRLFGLPRFDAVTARLPAKAYLLFALVLLEHRSGLGRNEAATELWADSAQDKAFANLRQLLASISRWQDATGLVALELDGRSILPGPALDPADITQFLALPAPASGTEITRLDALTGDIFLAGVDIHEPELTRWIADRRETLSARRINLLIAAGERGAFAELETALARDGQINPADERLARASMANLAGLGRDREAARVYDRLTRQLRDELDIEPAIETQALAARILQRKASFVSAPAAAPAPSADPPRQTPLGLPKIILLPPETSAWAKPQEMDLARYLVSDITLQLCRMRAFAMFAPHTARQLTGQDPLAAAAPYGVDYVVHTSIFPGARASRLAFSLIELGSQRVLCADEVLLEAEKLLGSQELVAERLARAIAHQVADVELSRYRATGAASAYVRFLLGSDLVQNTDLSLLRRARSHFTQALRLSPDYVPALAALARTYSIEWLLLGRSDRSMLRTAQELAQRAVELDPLNATGHRELGHASLYLGAFDESRMHFDAAVERAPHYADLLMDQADVLVHTSRPGEAKPLIEKAFALNPLAPDDYRWIGGSADFFLGNYTGALALLTGMQDQSLAGRLIAATAAMAGDFELAASHRDDWMARYPEFRLKDFAGFMPHSSRSDVERYVEALALAGFR